MPMIDVYTPAGLIPDVALPALARSLTAAVLEAEGRPNVDPYASNTAAFIHTLSASAIHTAARAEAPVVRVDVTTPPGGLDRDGQRKLVAEATRLVAEAGGAPELTARTWVILREAAEGGWGISGQALGAEEFAALAAGQGASA